MLHLAHPAFVHFSIAFLAAGGVLEATGILVHRAAWTRLGNGLVWAGIVSLVPTIATGYLALNTQDLPASAAQTMWEHERNAWIAFGAFFLTRFWKAWNRGELPQGQDRLYALATAGCSAWVLYNAWLGAELVYRHGVGVGAG